MVSSKQAEMCNLDVYLVAGESNMRVLEKLGAEEVTESVIFLVELEDLSIGHTCFKH